MNESINQLEKENVQLKGVLKEVRSEKEKKEEWKESQALVVQLRSELVST